MLAEILTEQTIDRIKPIAEKAALDLARQLIDCGALIPGDETQNDRIALIMAESIGNVAMDTVSVVLNQVLEVLTAAEAVG